MRHRFACLLILPLLVVFGCPAAPAPPAAQTPSLEELQQEYEAAIQDAQTAEPDEISRNLTAITPDNPDLIWSGEPGQSQVLMVTWTSWNGYAQAVGTSITLTQDVWVTAAPQVQSFCSADGATGDALDLRLEQLLGLPPDDGKTTFAELWANPADLFRPSADPEIIDHEATPWWPTVAGILSVSPEFVAWYEALVASSYGQDGYPWTRLGYTYDWGNASSEIGLSEFVIRRGATVAVRGAFSTADYCAAPADQ